MGWLSLVMSLLGNRNKGTPAVAPQVGSSAVSVPQAQGGQGTGSGKSALLQGFMGMLKKRKDNEPEESTGGLGSGQSFD